MNPAKTLQRRRKAACLTTEASAALQGPRVSTDPRLFKAQVGGTTSGGSVLGTGPTATMLAPTSSQPHGPAPCHAMEENTLEMNLCSRAEPSVLRTQRPWSAEGCPQAAGAATGRRMSHTVRAESKSPHALPLQLSSEAKGGKVCSRGKVIRFQKKTQFTAEASHSVVLAVRVRRTST